MCLAAPVQAQTDAPDASPSTPVETVELLAFEPTREDAVLEAFVDGVVEAHRRQHNTPGVTVSVVKDGQVIFAKGYGLADVQSGRAVSGDETLFRIGSVSKTFTWTAVMMLVEQGLIDLDADVNQYLKGVIIPYAFGAPVTMRDLMAHRAGFEDTFGVFTVNDESDISLTDALNAHMPKRVFAPGARTSYSNWGSALAAKIVEDVSGQSYENFLESEILRPLGMFNTTLKGPSRMPFPLRRKLATGLKLSDGGYEVEEPMEIGPYAPAGAMSASAEDMATWMLLHLGGGELNGVRLMAPATHEQMWTRGFDDRPAAADLAHGFFTKTYRGYDSFGHGGGTSAFVTYMTIVPELGIGVFVSQNAANERTLVSQLSDLIVDRVAAEISPWTPHTAIIEGADYVGAYLGNRRSFTQFEKLYASNGILTVTSTDDGALVATGNGQSTQLKAVAGEADVFEDQYGNRIAFGRNSSGRVTHITNSSGVHSFDRVGVFANPSTLNMAIGAAVLFSLTTWLGAWRRQGRETNHSGTGFALSIFSLGVSSLVFAFVAALALAVQMLSTATASDLLDYPPGVIVVLRLVGTLVFAGAVLSVISLAPAFAKSGWSIWRKIHHLLFVAAMAVMAVMLVQWKVIFSATA